MPKTAYDYQTGYVVYPKDDSSSSGKKAPYIDYGTSPPDRSRYYSKEEAALEWKHLWMKTWAFAGLVQDIPQIGDYFRYNLGKESFIITRIAAGDEGIKAFYNVCPHRGNRLVHTDFGHASDSCFTCDFHGWKYRLDGRNLEIADEEVFRKEVIADRPGLTAVSCAVWNSLVFVNPEPKPSKSLHEHLDVIVDHLAPYDFSKLRVLRDLEFCWEANWETAVDAFIEFYHAAVVHPEAIPVTETLECQYDLYGHGISRMIIPMGYVTNKFDDRETVNEYLKMFVAVYGGNPDDYKHLKGWEYKKALTDTKRKWGKKHGYAFFDKLSDDQIADDWNYFAFPNMTINAFADSVLLQIFRPHPTDPSKSYYSAITLCLPVTDDVTPVIDLNSFGAETFGPKGWKGEERPARFVPKELAEFGYLLAQDVRRVPEVQKGIESESFRGARLSELEIRIRHYLAEIDHYIGRKS